MSEDAEAAAAPILLSLIICSYNRANYVRRLILTLLAQLDGESDIELLVVDNNSKDDTRQIVERFSHRYARVRYLFEEKQGLSNARNCGAAHAAGEFLLFLDDDALAPEFFVAAMRRAIICHQPDFFGGPIYPIYADRLPNFFPEALEVRMKANATGFHRDVTMSGGNFGVRKQVLAQLGGFDPRYGMTGDKVGMLEERLLVDHYKEVTRVDRQKLYYLLEGHIFHHTPAARMSFSFQRRRICLAEYQMTRHLLAQGMRSPGMFFRAARQRFFSTLTDWVKTFIDPRATPEARFKSNIQIWRTWAVVHGCLAHLCDPKMRSGSNGANRKPIEAELRLLWLQTPEFASMAPESSRESKLRSAADEVLRGLPVRIERIIFERSPKNKDLNQRLIAASPHAFDAVLFDHELPEGVAKIARAHYPHLQFLVAMNRSRLMSVVDNIDFSVGKLRALRRNFAALKNAWLKDRATVRYADLVITTSHWERKFYLRLFGPRKKFAYLPPALPWSVMKSAQKSHRGVHGATQVRFFVSAGDLRNTEFDARQMFRAVCYFKAAQRKSKALQECSFVVTGKKPLAQKHLSAMKGTEFRGVMNMADYLSTISGAAGMVFGESFHAGHPTRFLEAAACRTPVVLPKSAYKKIDPLLRPFAESFVPGDAQSFADAAERALTKERPWDRVLQVNKAYRTAWANIVAECRCWMRPHAPSGDEFDVPQAQKWNPARQEESIVPTH